MNSPSANSFQILFLLLNFLIRISNGESGDDDQIDEILTENNYFDAAEAEAEQDQFLQNSTNNFAEKNATKIEKPNFDVFQTYLPLFVLVLEMSPKEKETLKNYLSEKTYEKLKYEIDNKVKIYPASYLINNQNNLSISNFVNNINRFDETTNDLIHGYHNASIYNAIRSVWLKQLRPFLPLIDQMAIMQYFSQKKEIENEKMSFWARIWENLSIWMKGKNHQIIECHAIQPKCVRKAIELLNFEERINLDKAANENQFDQVDEIIRKKLNENNQENELDSWLHQNRPPKSLESVIDERSDVEEEALQRLRDNGVISSLKHYYKAVIETKTQKEQKEIRKFFDTMNETFARCFDPLREQFHDF